MGPMAMAKNKKALAITCEPCFLVKEKGCERCQSHGYKCMKRYDKRCGVRPKIPQSSIKMKEIMEQMKKDHDVINYRRRVELEKKLRERNNKRKIQNDVE